MVVDRGNEANRAVPENASVDGNNESVVTVALLPRHDNSMEAVAIPREAATGHGVVLVVALSCDCQAYSTSSATVVAAGDASGHRRLLDVQEVRRDDNSVVVLALSTSDRAALLPSSRDLWRTVTLHIWLELRSTAGRQETVAIALDVLPAPMPEVSVFAGDVVAGGRYASLVGASPATASSIGRVSAARAVMLCDASNSAGGGVLQLTVGSGAAAGDVGAVVGNVLVALLVLAALCGFAAVYSVRRRTSLAAGLCRVALPFRRCCSRGWLRSRRR